MKRLARDDVDGAGGAAFLQLGVGGLVDLHRVDQLGRQQRVADAASDVVALAQHEPVSRTDAVTVDERLGQARAGATQTDAVGFVEAAFIGAGRADVHAGQASQSVGHVVCRELADVFGRHDFQARIGIALDVKRLLEARADARDDDFVDFLAASAVLKQPRPSGPLRTGCTRRTQSPYRSTSIV